MTGTDPASPPGPTDGYDLTARVFRALYQDYDLHWVAGIHVAVPTGSPCFAGPSLGAIARQISDHEYPAPPAPNPVSPPPLQPRRPPSRPDDPPSPHRTDPADAHRPACRPAGGPHIVDRPP